MSSLLQDLRYGLRMLVKTPGVTVFSVLAVAIGIGANTALFSMIYGVLLSPLPFPSPERLMWVATLWDDLGESNVSGPDYLDWAEQNTTFENLCALQGNCRFSLIGQGDPVALTGFRVSASFFDAMGGPPALGRGFLPEESVSGNHRVTVLSHRLWESRFDSNPDIVGQEIMMGDGPLTVVGVDRPSMGFLEEMAQLYVPFIREDLQQGRGRHYLNVIGRLKPDVTGDQAQADMSAIAGRLAQEHVQSNKRKGVKIVPLQEILIREVRTAFYVLYGAVGFLLLIACVNVANLLLAKSGARSKEIAIRCALGAGRLRIFRQVLTESVLLALIGGGLGLLLSLWGLDMLQLIAPRLGMTGSTMPGFDEIGLNSTVLAFTTMLSVCTGVVFGLVPAWQTSSLRIDETLKEEGRASSGGETRHRVLNCLVVSEIALALILLVGAGLLVKSFYNLQTTSPGFNSKRVLAVEMERPFTSQNEESRNRAAFYKQALQRIAALPGVESVGAINICPLSPYQSNDGFTIEGRPPLADGEWTVAEYRNVTQDYFSTMQIPLISGRFFTEHDNGSERGIVIVNEEFVRQHLSNEEPIGQRIRFHGTVKEIVGVVGDVKLRSLNAKEYLPFMYEPVDQNCWHAMTILARSHFDPMALASAVRQGIWSVDSNQPILRIRTMKQVAANSVSVEYFCMILLSAMAGVALLLAMIGIYGVIAYSVNQRTREIGIRMALGAQASDVLKLVVAHGLRLTLISVAIGLAGAFVLPRVLSRLLYEVSPTDPLTFSAASLVLTAIAVLASYIPARKAAKVDPMTALHYE